MTGRSVNVERSTIGGEPILQSSHALQLSKLHKAACTTGDTGRQVSESSPPYPLERASSAGSRSCLIASK